MSEAILEIGDQFPVHFVWKLPNGDYLRAVFLADILAHDWAMERYLVRLAKLKAGRLESPAGQAKPMTALNALIKQQVERLTGRRVQLAFEVADGRPVPLRHPTLTGEHNFFFRYEREEEE